MASVLFAVAHATRPTFTKRRETHKEIIMSNDHLFSNRPVSKELTIGGTTSTYYFRKLTAGEQIALNKGQKTTLRSGESTMEVDIADMHARNCQLLSYVWVDESGKQALPASKLREIPAEYIAAIVAAANEVISEPVPQ